MFCKQILQLLRKTLHGYTDSLRNCLLLNRICLLFVLLSYLGEDKVSDPDPSNLDQSGFIKE